MNMYIVHVLYTVPNSMCGSFDHFFDVHVFVTMLQNLPECSKLAYSNSYICGVSAPTLGLYVQSIALGKLIE